MITPGLVRRSVARAFQWRLLLLFVAGLGLPTLVAVFPLARALGELLDKSPRAKELIGALDSPGLSDLVQAMGARQLGGLAGAGVGPAGLVALFVAPLLAGMALAASRTDESLHLRGLFAGGAAYYGRMLRFAAAALLPLGLAATLASVFFRVAGKANAKAVTEAAATAQGRWALAGTVLVMFLAQTMVDLGRAHFAAQPHRRSAFFAMLAGMRFLFRRPLRALALSATGWGLALAGGALFLALRLRVPQQSGAGVALAFLLAQLAVAAVAWGRATRLIGFVELVRADAAERTARAEGFEMAPPATSPPAPREPAPEPEPAPAPAPSVAVEAALGPIALDPEPDLPGPVLASPMSEPPGITPELQARIEQGIAIGPAAIAPDATVDSKGPGEPKA